MPFWLFWINQGDFTNTPQLGIQLLVTIREKKKKPKKGGFFPLTLPLAAKFCESLGVGSWVLTNQLNQQTITHSSFLLSVSAKALEKGAHLQANLFCKMVEVPWGFFTLCMGGEEEV